MTAGRCFAPISPSGKEHFSLMNAAGMTVMSPGSEFADVDFVS